MKFFIGLLSIIAPATIGYISKTSFEGTFVLTLCIFILVAIGYKSKKQMKT